MFSLEFHRRQIQVKDLRRGLNKFPSYRDGREIFLCWERDEDDIEFWHDLETGFSGRKLCANFPTILCLPGEKWCA